MAYTASFTMLDAAGTPVSHTFNRTRQWVDPKDRFNYIEYLDTGVNGGVPRLANRLLMGTKVSSKSGGRNADDWQKTLTLACFTPIGETVTNGNVNGVQAQPQLAYDIPFYAKLIRPGRSSAQAAKDLRKFAYQILALPFVTDSYENLIDG